MTDSDEGTLVVQGLSDVFEGAGLFAVGMVIKNVTGFIFNWLLSISLGAGLFGVYVYAQLFLSVAQMFSDLGSKRAILRFLPEYSEDVDRQGGYIRFALVISILGSAGFGGGLWIFASEINKLTLETPELTTIIRILALSLPFLSLVHLASNSFRALGQIKYQILINRVLHPLLKVGFIAITLFIAGSLINITIGVALATSVTAVLGISLLLQRTNIQPYQSLSRAQAREFITFSIPISLSNVEGLMYSTVDVFMIGFFLSSTDVGIYKIALLLGTLPLLPLSAVNQMFAPIASKLYTNGEYEELATIYQVINRWVFSVVLLMSIGLTAYRREIMEIFGSAFVRGQLVFLIILTGYFVNASVGPVNWLLTMADRQYLVMVNSWISGFLNILLNYVFILEFGLIGAAIGTASSLILINITRMIEIWVLEGFQPYTRQYVKPILAGILASIPMFFSAQVLLSHYALFIGGFFGTALYFGALYLMGFEDRDKQVIIKILNRTGSQ